MFSGPTNPSKAHALLTSRQSRDKTTTRHGELVLAIGVFADSYWQSITDDNQPLFLFWRRSLCAIGLFGDIWEF